MSEINIFTFDVPEGTGSNKAIFYDVVKNIPDGAIVKISPFTQYLRSKGATLSEESCSRYMRYARLKWKWGVDFESLGKGCYKIKKEF